MIRSIPEEAPLEKVRINGHSMAPFILPGSTLHVERIPVDAIKVGDVACYIGGNAEVIAHRVVRKKGRGVGSIFTRGDARDFVEEVPGEAVISVVRRVEHPLLSYDSSGKLGRAAARVALGSDRRSRLAKRLLVDLWKRARSVKRGARDRCTTIFTYTR